MGHQFEEVGMRREELLERVTAREDCQDHLLEGDMLWFWWRDELAGTRLCRLELRESALGGWDYQFLAEDMTATLRAECPAEFLEREREA